MRIYIDDLRPVPEGWTVARDAFEAYAMLYEAHHKGVLERVSFDHDLASFDRNGREHTGYNIVLWMAENDIWPKFPPDIHSANPVGRVNIASTIARYGPYGAYGNIQ